MRRFFLAAAVALLAFLTGPAQAVVTPADGAVVSPRPVPWTPHVLDGEVRAMALVGDTVVVGGDFTGVTDSSGDRYHERWYLFAFRLGTGEVLDLAPVLDGPVLALEPGPDGTVYVGGRFRTVAGRARHGLTRIDLRTGLPSKGFQPALTAGDVRTLATAGGKLYIGGTFERIGEAERLGLARLDLNTGALDPDFDPQLAAPQLGRVKVEDLAVSPRGDRLLAIGVITQAMGHHRVQAAMFDLTRATLADWWTNAFNHPCRTGFDTWLRAADFSPGGDYVVIVTTGQSNQPHLLCDTASRFETYVTGEVKPTWVNHTGGDSLYAVEATGGAVYVGGHQRWLDNPLGSEHPGPGAVARNGLGAIDPVSGRANDWNPGRARGVGVRAFLTTRRGLLVGSDTDELAGEYHGRIGLFPY